MAQQMKDYWIDKETRAIKAKEHTAAVAAQWSLQIKASAYNTRIYSDSVNVTPYKTESIIVEVEDSDTVSAIFRINPEGKIAVLNFASYKNPGGMFLEGSRAQEESLCHKSFLYNVLSEHQDFYNKNKTNLNRGLYTNRALYTPDIMFFTDENFDVFRSCDVITCAAPNWGAASKYCNVSKEENDEVLKSRIKFVLDIAMKENAEILVLGAYGCGVFRQSPRITAQIFKELLKSKTYSFKRVIFAIPDGKNGNLDAFLQVFGGNEV